MGVTHQRSGGHKYSNLRGDRLADASLPAGIKFGKNLPHICDPLLFTADRHAGKSEFLFEVSPRRTFVLHLVLLGLFWNLIVRWR